MCIEALLHDVSILTSAAAARVERIAAVWDHSEASRDRTLRESAVAPAGAAAAAAEEEEDSEALHTGDKENHSTLTQNQSRGTASSYHG